MGGYEGYKKSINTSDQYVDIFKSDILIIGGGIAGCFAAMRASELGKDVTLLEKSTVRRGGDVGVGKDHLETGIGSPIPGSPSLQEALERAQGDGFKKELKNPNIYLSLEKEVYDRYQELESFGVKIREDDGSYNTYSASHKRNFPLMIRGVDIKIRLAEAVRKHCVNIVERIMAVELLWNNDVVTGAIVLNTRTGEISICLAKATILATGSADRQQIVSCDGLFLTIHPTTNSGDAHAMAYRAGAELVNAEFAGLDYTSCRDAGGVFGLHPFGEGPILRNRHGERVLKEEADTMNRTRLMIKEIREGRGPLYWDCSQMPAENFRIMNRNIDHECPITRKWYKQRGLDLRRDHIPVQIMATGIKGDILADENCRASMNGLYAAGAVATQMNLISGASTSGYRAAEVAANDVSALDEPTPDEEYLKGIIDNIRSPLGRKKGLNPVDLEEMVRGINTDYVGYYRTGGIMQKGLELLLGLRETHLPHIRAGNPHELMRCLELRNIFDLSEMHIRASLMRQETRLWRGGIIHHVRSDYPETDPAWDKWIVVKQRDGVMNLSTRELPELKDNVKKEINEMIERGSSH